MEGYIIIILIFGFISLFLLVLLYFINRILQYKITIDNSFIVVKDILDDRAKIVEDLIEFLKENLEHERSYRKKLLQAKKMILGIGNDKEGIEIIKKTESDLFSFVKLENTYKVLSKNKEYLKLKENILKNKERFIYAIDSYDKGVIDYNNYKENKLIYWLSKLCRIPEYDCYNK